MENKRNFKEVIADVEAFIFDVDGVMTDGKIIPIEGDFIRCYYAKDGYALAYAVKHGYNVCIISGGFGNNLESRLCRLGIEHRYLGCMDKIAAASREWINKHRLKAKSDEELTEQEIKVAEELVRKQKEKTEEDNPNVELPF